MGEILPLLPLRDIIVFPHMVVPLFVGRRRSIAALERAISEDRRILLAAQKQAGKNQPKEADIFSVGTVAHIAKLHRLEDNNVKVLVEGRARAKIVSFAQNSAHFAVNIEHLADEENEGPEVTSLADSVRGVFENYVKLNTRIPPEMLVSVQSIDDPARLADTIVAHVSLKLREKQKILETVSARKRLERLHRLMQTEIEILQLDRQIRSRVKKQMEKTQKEYYLNEQMQAIQKELGDRDEFKNELNDLERQIQEKEMSLEARERCLKELRKLKMMAPMSAEATVVRNYIEWVLALPWHDTSEEQTDITVAEKVLDEDHYGLEKIKERITEYLSVQALVEKSRGPILCFVGPPGVGKTSLARSIARATGRQFVRLSLGGVRDEAEIRGHRRTYIGALPGKLLQSLKKVGTNNPVFLLDEIDKMTHDFRGDPASALLEVLDPEQNETFVDHYLDLDYDLSQIMFITTANVRNQIPLPLQDRLEIIELTSYTRAEKVAIANQYLIEKQRKANGVDGIDLKIPEETLQAIIRGYTREAGVRNLEQKIATICRKIAKRWLVAGKPEDIDYRVNPEDLEELLGVRKFDDRQKEEVDEIGMANGLAVTAYGGDLLPAEVTVLPGKGNLTLTGKLGDVMQESARAAISYIRSRTDSFGLPRDFASKVDIHVHFPEGAIPKDGPSAGITMATAIASALLRVPARRDIAMTGEVTLRGRVLRIGGLKEKLLAAHRAEIYDVIIPAENERDLADVPKDILAQLSVHPVSSMDEVLPLALEHHGALSFLSEPTALIDWRQVYDEQAEETDEPREPQPGQRPH